MLEETTQTVRQTGPPGTHSPPRQNRRATFRGKWDATYPTIADAWERQWQGLIPFLSYPYIRKAIYTTNDIESLNRSLRKVTKNRGSFPSDEAEVQLLYLALRNIARKWTMPIRKWKRALNQFAILFPER